MQNGFSKKEIKASLIIVGIVIIEKILAFGKSVVFAYFFGAHANTDLYYLATNVVSLFNSCFNTSVPIAFLAVFINKGLRKKDTITQGKVMSNVVSSFLMIAICLTCILFMFAPFIEGRLAPTTSTNINDSLCAYIRILSFIIVIYCLSGVFSASLECLEIYWPSKLASLFESIMAILFAFFLGKKYGVIVAIFATLVGISGHAIFAYCILRKHRVVHFCKPKIDSNVKSILFLSGPMMIGVGITSINSLVDKIIAKNLTGGAVSALNYASLLSVELITAVLVTAVSSIITSKFAENIIQKDSDALSQNINFVLFLMLIIAIPVAIVFLGIPQSIITLVYERGAFDLEATKLTVAAFRGYSVGLFALPFREIFIRVQYSYQDSKRPMINSVICVLLNVFCSVTLSRYCGVMGIALATSISIVVNSFLSYKCIRKFSGINIKIDKNSLIKMFAIGIITEGILQLLKKTLPINNGFLYVAGSGIFVFIIYLLINYIFNKKYFVLLLEWGKVK